MKVDENKTPITDQTNPRVPAPDYCALFTTRGFHDWRWEHWPSTNEAAQERWCDECNLRQLSVNGVWTDSGYRKDEWQKAGFRKEMVGSTVVHSRPIGSLEILVGCGNCGSLLKSEWSASEIGFSAQAMLVVERCGCEPASPAPAFTVDELLAIEKRSKLTSEQADKIEDEMRALEADPSCDKHALRLFMQSPMPCGHAVGNLLTCPDPPFGCVVCNHVAYWRDKAINQSGS